MNEYLQLDQMNEVKLGETETLNYHEQYFILHQAVLEESSKTNKLLFVFNPSCPTSTCISINDFHYAAEKNQDNIFNILMRNIIPKYVIATDIANLFREV